MIRFLIKGILRDRSRSVLPVIVISIGVFITVVLSCWLNGIMGESVAMNANFNSGHVKVMTRAYDKDADQMPNEMALLHIANLFHELQTNYSEMDWVQRIRFGALIDFPDSSGITRAQGPVVGWGLDLLSGDSKEKERFNIEQSIIRGHYPLQASEALITEDFASKFKIKIGDKFTLFGTTMDGSMALKNFIVSGTVRFGSNAIDRGAVIIDLKDAQAAFAMEDAAGEILGYFKTNQYDRNEASRIVNKFNAAYEKSEDEFSPVMVSMRDQAGMAEMMDYSKVISGVMLFIFILAMSVVLWNVGLIGSLRRYNEFGVRLALGEAKTQIYKSLIAEGILIGCAGTVIGTILGLALSYYLQTVGLNIGGIMKNSTMMMPVVARAIITPQAFYIGFIPGLCSMVFGTALAGIGIYKRQTAQLFKELEN